jgi:methylmalonyl-CoA mutase cobalamin-binding subunit
MAISNQASCTRLHASWYGGILAGFKQTSAQLVEAALQEDADVLAISSLAGAI